MSGVAPAIDRQKMEYTEIVGVLVITVLVSDSQDNKKPEPLKHVVLVGP